MSAFGSFVGRLLLALLFLLSGAMKFSQFDSKGGGPVVAYMAPKLDSAVGKLKAATGAPIPDLKAQYPLLSLAAGTLELLGGLLFVLNVPLGAVLLVGFLIPTTVIMHNFWDMPDGTPGHQIEFINFMKNLCILGGLLIYIYAPSGVRPAAAPGGQKLKTR